MAAPVERDLDRIGLPWEMPNALGQLIHVLERIVDETMPTRSAAAIQGRLRPRANPYVCLT